ncbi:hypothetical protein FNH47_12615 [Salmonella enterica subsp. houtenae]|uniref:Uncharacterized protein n=1 Tax=Salmonella houtenae TaxID=59205 RepID=A0A5Y2SEA3_SALHO|nr:hypothetical protein [Salmonella enterica subsp. houtenae]QKT20662.1 hypothetical protein HPG84_23465 [Salmonella enterica]HAU3224694.1 hypothetical protein [Salmonella enterica subsp. houtenae]
MLAELIKRCLDGDCRCRLLSSGLTLDPLAEVRRRNDIWEVDGKILMSCEREDDLLPAEASQICPECWIQWKILNPVEAGITPVSRSFTSECQQNYWLKRQTC